MESETPFPTGHPRCGKGIVAVSLPAGALLRPLARKRTVIYVIAQGCLKNCCHAICRIHGNLVLPYAHHAPAESLHVLIGFQVPRDISKQLGIPPRAVPLRPGAVLRTTVPKATVNENHHPACRECQVRTPARKAGQRLIDSIPESTSVQNLPKRNLGLSVLRTLPGHSGGSLGIGRSNLGTHGDVRFD